MAVSRIQAFVLGRLRLPVGNYEPFAVRLEHLLKAPVLTALDEYGIPIEVGEKLLSVLGTTDDLDTALASLLNLEGDDLDDLDPFERELVVDAQKAISPS